MLPTKLIYSQVCWLPSIAALLIANQARPKATHQLLLAFGVWFLAFDLCLATTMLPQEDREVVFFLFDNLPTATPGYWRTDAKYIMSLYRFHTICKLFK